MDITLLLKTVGVGLIVASSALLLQKSGRDEQATLVTVVGIIVVVMMLVGEIGELFDSVKGVFGL